MSSVTPIPESPWRPSDGWRGWDFQRPRIIAALERIGDVLIADKANNRLLEVDPWSFLLQGAFTVLDAGLRRITGRTASIAVEMRKP